ncbi:MAG: hypothetical protein CVV44_07820 [Spirochaetae bacterium HGW-Spirochaetae-1]|jgi:hypothetical protein|nr:MAG: hypothetical protein CVV44_07820 [Spirochaetae bacterium HGW-Spirochaetae-1]
MTSDDNTSSTNTTGKPMALVLAGYNRFDPVTKKKYKSEIQEAYDGEEIYLGENKFLYMLAGKPVIHYVIDAVNGARKDGEPLYDKIYVYNDVKSFRQMIDVDRYPHLILKQMTDSVGGHWKDFYRQIDYGQRVDVFFGDTPRITSEDVEYIHGEYSNILGKEKDHRGVLIHMAFGVVEFTDMTDDWLAHRVKYIKHGQNKGKLKSYVGYDTYQGRVGNTGAIIKHKSIDDLMEYECVNFLYNLRKALTPSSFSKILFHLWKTRNYEMIRQVKNRCINENYFYDTVLEIYEKLYKIDLSNYGGKIYHIKKNPAHWENDIDGPNDLMELQRRFVKMKG